MDEKKQDTITHRPDQIMDAEEAEVTNIISSLP
jgi:hypothetical protein